MPIISVSLPKKQVSRLKQIAQKQGRARSQIIGEAIQLYDFESRWTKLRKSGDLIAKRMGLESDDDVERIAG